MAQEVLLRTVDFGVLTFNPSERELLSLLLGPDELVLLVPPQHPLAGRRQITMEEMGRQPVIAHNDPSPARDRVLRLYEQRHAPLNIRISLPSLDGIKRAVEMGLGVGIVPSSVASHVHLQRTLVVVPLTSTAFLESITIIYRRDESQSRNAAQFVEIVRRSHRPTVTANGEITDVRRTAARI
jgi:DNA-binding transcriptional LysR family regulator